MTISVVEAQQDLPAVPERAGDTGTAIAVDQLVTSLAGTAEAAQKHPLSSLSSHSWFSITNYRDAVKWCAAISAATGSARRDAAARETVQFLVSAIVDRYHNDRALYAASHLPDKPVPQRFRDVPVQIQHNGRIYDRHTSALAWSLDMPVEAVHRVADIAAQAVPDKWHIVTYQEHIKTYDPIIYACYGDWVVKVAEWV